jgi:short subunit dehydrogenase-like uncharacterized protein
MMHGAGLARLRSLYDTISLRDESLSPQGLGPLPHLETANGYRLTADGTLMAVKFVLDDAPAGGYYTPSMLMGARCVEQLPGSTPIRVE